MLTELKAIKGTDANFSPETYYKKVDHNSKININILDLFENTIPLTLVKDNNEVYLLLNNDIKLKRFIRNDKNFNDIFTELYNEKIIISICSGWHKQHYKAI